MKKLKLIASLPLLIFMLTGMKKSVEKSTLLADTILHSNGNPIITHQFTADPAAMVYKDKVYLFTGHDEAPTKVSSYRMHNWLCFSSPDMVNWTEYPSPLNVKDFTWAKDDAWAGQVIERNGKFYWYVAIEHVTIHGKAIGVAVADKPEGPYKDARGSALITNDMTTKTRSAGTILTLLFLLTMTGRLTWFGVIPAAIMPN